MNFEDVSYRGRQAFLDALVERLAADNWQYRLDTGWGNWDLEVYGDRWSKLRLITVAEQPDEGWHRVRCRLRTSWTLPAKLAYGVVLAAALLAMAVWRVQEWLAWIPLVAPALAAWRFSVNQRNLRRVMSVVLEEVALGLGMRHHGDGPPFRASRPGLEPRDSNHAH
jgi:hypothetical protein